jgi:hypothetical protein
LTPFLLFCGTCSFPREPAVAIVLFVACAANVVSAIVVLRTSETATAPPPPDVLSSVPSSVLVPLAGRRAFVRWVDGKTYAAVLIGIERRGCAVVFANGRRAWVPLEVCSLG